MVARPDSWMPLYIGDYLADTLHLTAEQHGAYLLLIMAYWRRGGPLPEIPAELCRIARVPPRRWDAVWAVVRSFFVTADGVVSHPRIERELARSIEGFQRRSDAGRNAVAKRWNATHNHNHIYNKEMGQKSYGNGATKAANGAATGGPLDTSEAGPLAAVAAENRRRHKAGLAPMNAKELAAWKRSH